MMIYEYPQQKANKDINLSGLQTAIETAITTVKFGLYPARPEFYVATDTDLTPEQETTLDDIVPPYLI